MSNITNDVWADNLKDYQAELKEQKNKGLITEQEKQRLTRRIKPMRIKPPVRWGNRITECKVWNLLVHGKSLFN